MFLTGMFLLVGGPLFAFSGRAYVDSSTAFASNFSDLQFRELDCFVIGFFSLRGFASKTNDSLLAIDVDFRLRRITNIANETPIITTTHAPTVPPTTVGELSDEESGTLEFSEETAVAHFSPVHPEEQVHHPFVC